MVSFSAQRVLLDEFAQTFGDATQLPVSLHRSGEFFVTDHPRVPSFCRIMAENRKGCRECAASHLALQDPVARKARTSVCFAGLTSSAVPVLSSEGLLGYLHTGHVYVDRSPGCGQPGPGCYLPQRARAGCRCAGACRQTALLTTSQYEGALGLLRIFAAQLASLGRSACPPNTYPAIQRAVQDLRRDVARKWSLPELARRAGMHPTYFSEKFREHAGCTFTAFLAGLRVRKAGDLLRFTALPITEIAFASGFHSLSQFNRTYRARTGETPGQTRRAG